MLLPLLLLVAQSALASSPQRPGQGPGPATWVAFSADLKIEHPTRPTAYGRQLQDEHGCMRRETVHPDGSLMVTILNFQAEKTYQLMRGKWTSRPMRLVPSIPRRPPTLRVDRRVDPIEGFDAYTSTMNVTGPRGNFTQETVVLPALNYLQAIVKHQNGETITAHNIRLGAPDHAEFLPPANATIEERPEPGGAMTFQAVVVRVSFEGGQTSELVTTEEQPSELRTPTGETFQIVTRMADGQGDNVRIRIMKNAVRAAPGRVTGDVLDEVEFVVGETAKTTKLVENFSIAVTRVGGRQIR